MNISTSRKRLYNMGDLFAIYNLVCAIQSVRSDVDDAVMEGLESLLEDQNNYLLEVTGVDTLAIVKGYSAESFAYKFNEDTNLDVVYDELRTLFPRKLS